MELVLVEERKGRVLLQGALQGMRKRGMKVETEVVLGDPADKVTAAATREDVDLVVAGTTGKHALERVFLHSVTTRLFHLCTKPVLVVP